MSIIFRSAAVIRIYDFVYCDAVLYFSIVFASIHGFVLLSGLLAARVKMKSLSLLSLSKTTGHDAFHRTCPFVRPSVCHRGHKITIFHRPSARSSLPNALAGIERIMTVKLLSVIFYHNLKFDDHVILV